MNLIKYLLLAASFGVGPMAYGAALLCYFQSGNAQETITCESFENSVCTGSMTDLSTNETWSHSLEWLESGKVLFSYDKNGAGQQQELTLGESFQFIYPTETNVWDGICKLVVD